MVVYLQTVMRRDPAAAAAQAHWWTGAAYVAPLLGGALADGLTGRPATILGASTLYTVGLGLLTLQAGVLGQASDAASPPPAAEAMFAAAFAAIALATGGIKPVVSPCGADQCDDADPAQADSKQSFFNWYYFAINVGALASSTMLVYLQTEARFGGLKAGKWRV